MIDFSLFNVLWIGLFLTAFSSFFVFFTKQFRTFVMGACLVLSGITFQLLGIDIVIKDQSGQIIAIGLWILFLFQIIAFKWALKAQPKKTPVFFFLPFLAFISMSISVDLLTFALGLTLFSITFATQSALKEKSKEKIFIVIQKMTISFLCYAYGMVVLFSREGNILLNKLHLKDEWTGLGIGLLILSVGIEIYAIIPLIGKKNERI